MENGKWKMSVNPDPCKQAVEIIFSRKTADTQHSMLMFNFNKLFSENLSRVISESKETVILGDVNVNYLNKNANKDFKSILNLFGMKKIITTPTRITNNTSTLIDIIATTHCQHIKTFCTIPSGIADHEMVGCVRKVNHIKYEPKTITCRDYRNYQPDLARNDLNSKDWNYFYFLKDVNAAWKVLSDYLTETINTHAPKITRRIKGKPCPWITPDIKALMSERDKMLRKSRKTKNELDISSYKNLRNRVNIMVRNAVSTYNKNLLSENKSDPRKFWSVIKSIYKMKGNSEITSHTFKINGEETSNKLSIADGFCSYFTTIVGKLKCIAFPLTNLTWKKPSQLPKRSNQIFRFKYVSNVEVQSYLKSISRTKATGMDDIPAGFLKDTATVISAPLAHLTNMSLQTGIIPTPWKMASYTRF